MVGTVPSKCRILVVDDVMQNLQVVGSMLRKEGYDVMPARSGTQALECVGVRVPDLVLLDLMMPEMDGLEVCRRLREDKSLSQIPIIFLTASNELEHLVKGFSAGAVDYVTKPFNGPELLARVRTHLELKLARERLREMNDEKNEFMGIAAHDLRNPLTTIKGFSELIVEDAQSLNMKELEENGRRVLEAAKRMTEMLQNLLDANRIERGEMSLNLTPAELTPIVDAVVESQLPRAAAKRQNLVRENDPPPIRAVIDSRVMVQVLENLISNAVKYSPPGKSIFVRLRKDTDTIRCEVQDEGPGLTKEDQKKLFGKFARLSAKPTGGENATGLGLSIVKCMVEAMKGKVWCESEPGKGATFIVTFPGTGASR
jgi:signal transduction histidine kinase